MRETRLLEVCGLCAATVAQGAGDPYRVDLLWRKFQGTLVISEVDQIVTHRNCGACGEDTFGVRYAAVGTIHTEEDAA